MTRRGVIIVAVLIVLTLSSLVAGSVLLLAGLVRTQAAGVEGRTQSRATAWSAVAAVMAEVASQRDDVLTGAMPTITEEAVLYREVSGAQGRFRVLADAGPALRSEQARLDLNASTAEMLARLPGLDARLAGAIVAARDAAGPFEAVSDLLSVEGITAELLEGEGLAVVSGSGPGERLADLVTVHSFDPEVQAGIGEGATPGIRRVDISVKWSDELERAIAERWGDEVATGVRAILERAEPITSRRALVGLLRAGRVEAASWGEVLDLFVCGGGEFATGRVDVNRAPASVLACLPGMTAETAEALVAARDSLGADALRSLAWPVAEGIVTEDDFALLADWITTRSSQWRFRVEAGERAATLVPGEDFGLGEAFDTRLQPDDAEVDAFGQAVESAGAEGDAGPGLRDRIVLEAVIDIASTRPRVAYLADVTLAEVSAVLAAREAVPAAIGAGVSVIADGGVAPGVEGGGAAVDADGSGTEAGGAGPADPFAFFDEGSGAFDRESAFGGASAFDRESAFGGPSAFDDEAPSPEAATVDGGGGGAGVGAADPRLGRWTARRKGGR